MPASEPAVAAIPNASHSNSKSPASAQVVANPEPKLARLGIPEYALLVVAWLGSAVLAWVPLLRKDDRSVFIEPGTEPEPLKQGSAFRVPLTSASSFRLRRAAAGALVQLVANPLDPAQLAPIQEDGQ